MKLTAGQIATVASKYWSGHDAVVAVAICLAESGGETTATHKNSNGTTDFGLWQINSVHGDLLAGKDWTDPNVNAGIASQIWAQAGNSFTPWSTYTSGAYFIHMGVASAAVKNGGQEIPTTASNAALLDPLGGVGSILTLGTLLGDPNLWLRIAEFILGFILLIIAFMKMTGNNQMSGTTKGILAAAGKKAVEAAAA